MDSCLNNRASSIYLKELTMIRKYIPGSRFLLPALLMSLAGSIQGLIAQTQPSPPLNPALQAITDRVIRVSWDVPAYTGGLPILNYTISYGTAESPPSYRLVFSPSLTQDLANLTPSTEYTVKIRASNAAFSSEWTEAISIYTLDSGPAIVSLAADDPDNGDAIYSNGDRLKMIFDEDTNQPAAATKSEIDGLLEFNAGIGMDYYGSWPNAQTLEIIITDAGIAVPPVIGVLTVKVRASGNLKNAAETSDVSRSESPPLSGNWGNPNSPVETDPSNPETPGVLSIYPNPFNPSTEITYTQTHSDRVLLKIYDMLGREITTLIDLVQGPGNHTVTWHGRAEDGSPCPSGRYLVFLKTGDRILTKQITLMR
jgi:hypothetical protein